MRIGLVILAAVILVSLYVVNLDRRAAQLPGSYVPPFRPRIHASAARSRAKPTSIKIISPVVPWREPVGISGPLSDRLILRRVLPTYPDWAEEQGVAGSMSFLIWVGPEGGVKSVTQVVRASLSPKLDEVALQALDQWQFSAVPDAAGVQWGIVTFHFMLDVQKQPVAVLPALERPTLPFMTEPLPGGLLARSGM